MTGVSRVRFRRTVKSDSNSVSSGRKADLHATLTSMKLACLTHVAFEGPAHIAAWANYSNIDLQIVRVYEGGMLPASDRLDGLLVMGGPMAANDESRHPWLTAEKRLIDQCMRSDVPVVGICLGAQIIASVLGARISKSQNKEIGWYQVSRTKTAERSLLRDVLPMTMTPFHWHGDTFSMPAGSCHLYASSGCENQAFAIGAQILGLQFHLESTEEAIEALVDNCPDDIVPGKYVAQPRQMLDKHRCAAAHDVLNAILSRIFLDGNNR